MNKRILDAIFGRFYPFTVLMVAVAYGALCYWATPVLHAWLVKL